MKEIYHLAKHRNSLPGFPENGEDILTPCGKLIPFGRFEEYVPIASECEACEAGKTSYPKGWDWKYFSQPEEI